jgi:hypothetical protein
MKKMLGTVWTKVALIAVVGLLAVAGTAYAGGLPASVQKAVAGAADTVGVTLPAPDPTVPPVVQNQDGDHQGEHIGAADEQTDTVEADDTSDTTVDNVDEANVDNVDEADVADVQDSADESDQSAKGQKVKGQKVKAPVGHSNEGDSGSSGSDNQD